jgi:cAMP-dependent protein kinase regulator
MLLGDAGDNFYVVESGDFDIFVNGNRVASRGPGTSFGELALLYNSPRAATVTSTKPSVLWALDRHTFRHMLASSREFHLDTVISALRNVPLLRSLTAEQLDKIADAVQVRWSCWVGRRRVACSWYLVCGVKVMSFKPGDTIIRKGDTGDAFYIIKSGKVVCTGAGTASKVRGCRLMSCSQFFVTCLWPRTRLQVMADEFLTEGSYFGERALLMSAPRAANVIAVDQVRGTVTSIS